MELFPIKKGLRKISTFSANLLDGIKIPSSVAKSKSNKWLNDVRLLTAIYRLVVAKSRNGGNYFWWVTPTTAASPVFQWLCVSLIHESAKKVRKMRLLGPRIFNGPDKNLKRTKELKQKFGRTAKVFLGIIFLWTRLKSCEITNYFPFTLLRNTMLENFWLELDWFSL